MGGTSANRLTAPSTANSINGDTLGATGGHETHEMTEAEMPAHDHGGTTGSTNLYTDNIFDAGFFPNGLVGTTDFSEAGTSSHAHSIASDGGGGAHNNVQPTIILNYIIRATTLS